MKKKTGRPARKPATITHTELASADPAATRAWCAKVLGWTFMPSVPMHGGGEYMLFAYSDKGGGGIRPTFAPGSVPVGHSGP